MQKWPRKATARWRVSVETEIFSVAIELSGSVSRHGSLCRNIVPMLQAGAGSRQGFSSSYRVIFFCLSIATGATTVLRQCFGFLS